jgi:hypothetical protein
MSFEQTIFAPSKNIITKMLARERLVRRLALSNHIVDISIEATIKDEKEYGIINNLPEEERQMYRDLRNLGTSRFNPDLKSPSTFKFDQSIYPIIRRVKDIRTTWTQNNTELEGGDDILQMLRQEYSNFTDDSGDDRDVFLVQGSATKRCPYNHPINDARKAAKEGKVMVLGGTGVEPSENHPGCVMFDSAYEYLLHNGVLLVIVIIPSLMRPIGGDIKHTEIPFFTDENNIVKDPYKERAAVLVAKDPVNTARDLAHRLGAFQYITTKGKKSNGKAGIYKGGPGTATELKVLLTQEYINPELGSFEEIILSPCGIWDNYYNYYNQQLAKLR